MEFGRTPQDIEHNRKAFLIALYAWAGAAVLVPLGGYSLVSGRLLLGLILLGNAGMVLGTLWYSRVTRRVKGASFLFSVQAGALAAFLALHGGIEGSGVYFSFPLALMMVMLGFTQILPSIVQSGILLLAVALGFYLGVPGVHDYPGIHRSRILLGLGVLCLMTMIIEWLRVSSYAAITHTAELLHVDAIHDALTGLMNRRGFESEVAAMSDGDFPAVMGVIDIDHFKRINDEYGHDAGDQALKSLSDYLKGSVKGRDLMCRWGGEEFVVIFTQLSFESGLSILDQIREEISVRPLSHGGRVFNISFSAGVVVLKGKQDFHTALQLADERLYYAKQSGRNRVVSGMSMPSGGQASAPESATS